MDDYATSRHKQPQDFEMYKGNDTKRCIGRETGGKSIKMEIRKNKQLWTVHVKWV